MNFVLDNGALFDKAKALTQYICPTYVAYK